MKSGFRMIVIALLLFSLALPSGAEEICFPLADGMRMLSDIETLAMCKTTVAAGEQAINSCEARASVLEHRVAEQDGEIVKGKKTIEETRKAGEDAAKVAAGPWYSRALSVVKWIALGIVVGFVGGMAK